MLPKNPRENKKEKYILGLNIQTDKLSIFNKLINSCVLSRG